MSGLLRGLVFFVVLGAIVYSGLRPHALPVADDTQNLLLHVLAFAALVGSARLAFASTHAFWTVLYSLIFALMLELLQGLFPEGAVSVPAIAANILGVFAGLAVAQSVKQLVHRRQARQGW
ncbi:VanZ family protein [Pseudomonas turukhanskensis]|uniref:VanZ-like domain-containing protein n=1 Tax=Pseudomonas turukhanskensis TaxID=1806536 RepID=A0A9W6K256_9PSED|nr:VanZ family protein [Pseudomonas turukhanskensis]GLK88096.1 hypothetical protein GCM10017655_11580 [Pseudomonas turukhanskensis]